ncbi:hypothetical protein L207DRAFT_593129 [Hyaloscypha variabilis F]|uniref:Uncharacterized protein n=1 Tax=Hyaloscypha variabilis (strain UAMH 11265 / GT02V1 / F) TaxID=1149755 RepID=A0A2J6QU78_HYAVF|nr:hypothetical protein L207DRAFT_593129 [Hyaloscypha variabilis F]
MATLFLRTFILQQHRNRLNGQACINKIPYESVRRYRLDLSQCLPDNPLPTEQAFDDEYNRWIHWAFIHIKVSENDPMSPPQQGLQKSQEVSELQRYQAEYLMWRAHCDDAYQAGIGSTSTPRASQQHHHAAQDNTKVAMDAKLNAIESRLASLESRVGALELVHGRPTRCQRDAANVRLPWYNAAGRATHYNLPT